MAPIEPAAITAAALLATKALEALGGKAGETTWAGMSRLVALIRSRVAGHRRAETALARLERHPDGHEHVRELAELLTTFAAQDAGFHRDLVALVADARRDPTIGSLAAQVYGQAQVGQLFTIGQMRDVHFHAAPASRLVSAAPPQPIEVRWPTLGRTVTNLPLRNPTFTGRKELLERLHERLHPGQAAAVVQVQAQAVHGLGGIGKTQRVLEYAHRHVSAYDLIWWVTAEPPAAIPGQLVSLARRLGIPEYAEQAETVAALLDELRHHDRWLVIFDNAEQPEDLHTYWPSGGGGHVLVTSRNPTWGRLAATVQVNVLQRPESVAFLQRRTALNPQEADALADALADLPLALEQAAAYLDETRTPCSEYLDLLRDRSLELFALGRPGDSKQTIATTWTVSLDRIKTQAPVAEDLLTLCAFLAPEDVPRGLFAKHPDRLPDPLATAVRDRVTFQQALGALRRYSLATVTLKAVSVHRLVQAVVRNSLGIAQAKAWAAAAVKLVLAGFPGQADDVRVWPEAARLLPHALIATGHVRTLSACSEVLSVTWREGLGR